MPRKMKLGQEMQVFIKGSGSVYNMKQKYCGICCMQHVALGPACSSQLISLQAGDLHRFYILVSRPGAFQWSHPSCKQKQVNIFAYWCEIHYQAAQKKFQFPPAENIWDYESLSDLVRVTWRQRLLPTYQPQQTAVMTAWRHARPLSRYMWCSNTIQRERHSWTKVWIIKI